AMAVEDVAHACLQSLSRRFRRKAEIEPDLQRARDDVARSRAGVDVRDLEARGLKVRIAAIPWHPHELAQCARGVVNGIAAALGIRDVALLAVHAQLAVERPAPGCLH